MKIPETATAVIIAVLLPFRSLIFGKIKPAKL